MPGLSDLQLWFVTGGNRCAQFALGWASWIVFGAPLSAVIESLLTTSNLVAFPPGSLKVQCFRFAVLHMTEG